MKFHRPSILLGLALVGLFQVRSIPATPVSATLGIDPDQLAGADANGRVLLYAINPVMPGSSIVHWDTSAVPNLLMEPSINSDLSSQQTDLTVAQMRDVGWPSGSSTITLRNMDPPGQGFNDPSLGAARLAAMQRVASVWASLLQSSVEINVDIGFGSLECSQGAGVLAQAGAQFLFQNFSGAPINGTWYHGALAEALSGQNLSLEDTANPDAGDLALTFNSQIDQACLGAGSRFFYGLNGNPPAGQISFVNVALHEMAHGLGFSTFADVSTGALFMNDPDIYSRFIFDNTLGRTWNQMTNTERRASAINDGQVAWSGARVANDAPNFLGSAPTLTLNSPASIAGNYRVGVASFGPPLGLNGVSGDLVVAVDESSDPTLLCEAVAAGLDLVGRIAVVDRGTCNFAVKVKNAQDAGALGVIVVNNVPGPPSSMGGTDGTIVIPSVQISQDDGELIKATLAEVSEPGVIRFNASSFSVAEGAGSATVTVRRAEGTDGAVTVDYATGDGSATAGEDYEPASGTITFGQGEGGTKSIQVLILDDELTEGEERVTLELSNPTGGASLGSPSSVELSIDDDDVNPAGFLAFSSAEYQVGEGEGSVVISVERRDGTLGAVTVDYVTADGSAQSGSDYVGMGGILTFVDGEGGTKSFTIEITDDEEEELIEIVQLALSNPTGGALLGAPSMAVLEIVDNEACQASATRLCLNQGRFRVDVRWRDFNDITGLGQVVVESDDSGLLWFFTADNWEMLVKVLDGCAITDHFWVFSAATTNVEYTLEVTDTLTGDVQQYVNPLGVSASAITDTGAFATCSAGGRSPGQLLRPADAAPRERIVARPVTAKPGVAKPGVEKTTGTCQADETRFCLNQGRFQVDVLWRDFNDGTGTGHAVIESDDSGLMWFFSPDNWELLVKVLDGCAINDRYWVFAAATTNVEYTLRVTDTTTGEVYEQINPLGVSASAITDTNVFASCP